ncbi:MAG TPA: hypothetical protein VK545_02625 [Streptomyces sp.]|nr:hypothetical protein [Streptomyces sp.]
MDSGPRALLSTLARSGLPGCRTAAPLRTPADLGRMRERLIPVLDGGPLRRSPPSLPPPDEAEAARAR